jgi:SynChlorMet cassette radical SAM/SPASM protein ScmF
MLADAPIAKEAPEVPVPALRSLYFYLTDECNQSCIHCWINPTLEGRSRTDHPSLDDYCRLIDAALPLGLEMVKLTGGEPLLRKETLPIIQHVFRVGAHTLLETNGMLVGPREAELFQEHRVSVGISLDGSVPAVHDRRRGLQGAFERTWRALELMDRLEIPMTVTAAISRSNREEVPKILELLSSLDRKARLAFKINPIMSLGRARKLAQHGDALGPEELLDLVRQICDELIPWARERRIGIMLQLELAFFPIDGLAQGAGKAGVCHCGFLNLLSVLADGSLTLCGIGYANPELIMGNIRGEYDLAAIWNNHSTLRSIRATVNYALEGVCGDCLFQPICLGGCRASALGVGGSLAASPPNCQALYDAGLFLPSRLREPAASHYTALCQANLLKGGSLSS